MLVRRRLSYLMILAGALAAGISSIYIFGTYFAPVNLHVFVNCQKNSSQSQYCGRLGGNYFNLDDSLLEKSPKLKEGLDKVLTVEPVYGERTYIVGMTMSEFDSMNRLLVNTNQTYVLQQYAQRETPMLSLFPKENSIVFVNYNGSSYQLIPEYPTLAPFGQWWS